MATPKKKHLIELMIEAGVKWPNGAEYAAQDKGDKTLHFYSNGKPNLPLGTEFWMAHNCDHDMDETIQLELVCRNWHQTIVTREQYAEALEAASVTQEMQHKALESDGYPSIADAGCFAWHNPPSIEQLTADYHAKASEADRLQAIAAEAIKAADDALIAIEKAGELIGLVISIDTKPKQVAQQCNRAEWKIGDNCIVTDSPDGSDWVGRECVLIRIDTGDGLLPYKVVDKEEQEEFWVRSIRRP